MKGHVLEKKLGQPLGHWSVERMRESFFENVERTRVMAAMILKTTTQNLSDFLIYWI